MAFETGDEANHITVEVGIGPHRDAIAKSNWARLAGSHSRKALTRRVPATESPVYFSAAQPLRGWRPLQSRALVPSG